MLKKPLRPILFALAFVFVSATGAERQVIPQTTSISAEQKTRECPALKLGIIVESLRIPLPEGIVLARQLGADGIQLYAVSPYFNMLTASPEEIVAVRRLCDENHLEISAICADLGGFGFVDQAGNPERLKKIRKIIACAKLLGTNVLTSHIGTVPRDTSDPAYDVMVKALRTVGGWLEQEGMVLAIETGPETPEELLRFLKTVGSHSVGVNMDPANLVMVQNSDPVAAVKLLAKYIFHTHAKDGVHYRDCDPVKVYDAFATGGFEKLQKETGELFAETPLGKGSVPWPQYLAALNAIGFDGYLTIERECGSTPKTDIREALIFLHSQLQK